MGDGRGEAENGRNQMRDGEMEDQLAGSIGAGIDVGWEKRQCNYCGGEARFPAGLFGSTALATVPAICDACEDRDKLKSIKALLATDTVELFERSGAPDAPAVMLHWRLGNFVNDDQRGMFITGPPGAYKTSNAAQLIRAWSKQRGLHSVYTRERKYFEACWDKDRPTLDRMRNTPLLIVDDLGTDHESDWSASLFYDLVDARYASQRKTVWISNRPMTELAEFKHFDGRVMRRLFETCGETLEMGR
jgi:DNA replication protein DnaC